MVEYAFSGRAWEACTLDFSLNSFVVENMLRKRYKRFAGSLDTNWHREQKF